MDFKPILTEEKIYYWLEYNSKSIIFILKKIPDDSVDKIDVELQYDTLKRFANMHMYKKNVISKMFLVAKAKTHNTCTRISIEKKVLQYLFSVI